MTIWMAFLHLLFFQGIPFNANGMAHAQAGGNTNTFSQSFNGTSQASNTAQVVCLDTSGSCTAGTVTTVTISFWLYQNSFANNDALLGESSSDFNSNNGSFLLNPNSSTSGVWDFKVHFSGGTYLGCYFARPSAAAWHFYVLQWNVASTCQAYVDGSAVSTTADGSFAGTPFVSQTVYLMSRGASSLWNAGKLAEFAMWTSYLTSGNVTTLWNSGNGALATSIPTPIRYWHGCDATSDVITGSWTATGSPSQTAGPGFLNCP